MGEDNGQILGKNYLKLNIFWFYVGQNDSKYSEHLLVNMAYITNM